MDDVVVIGGGIIGASAAYFLSKEGRKVKVIERDPTYKNASFPLSLGGFRRQFFQKEKLLRNDPSNFTKANVLDCARPIFHHFPN